uniref:GtrA-like protein domain-containing protein n=1 Tax=viral metagenome TaxID=1070528 RepID=A0A6C0C0J6_9ZZZZ
MIETKHQALVSAIVGGVLVIIYLSITDILDKYMSLNMSNIVGLIIDYVLNFVAQQYVFYGKVHLHKKVVNRFMIGNTLSMGFTQAMFVYGRKHYNKLIEKTNIKLSDSVKISSWRYISNALMFLIVTFPLRKYYIFK